LTVAQHDLDVDLVLGDRLVADSRSGRADALERRIRDGRFRELLDAAFAADEPDRGGVIDRVLALERALQVALVAQVEHQRRDSQAYARDRIGRRMVLAVELATAVD